jgi:hypothetical protein
MSTGNFAVLVVISVAAFLLVFTCSTVFVVALTKTPKGQRADLPAAWADTRLRWRRIVACAVASGLVVVGLFALARTFARLGYTTIGLATVGVLVGLIALVPVRVASATPRKRGGSRVDRARGLAVGSSASLILEAPTIGMSEVGRLFTRVPGLRIFGWAAVVIGGLLHMAAQSSTRAFKFTSKFVGDDEPMTDKPKADEPRTNETKADEPGTNEPDPGAPTAAPPVGGLRDLDPVAGPADEELDDEQQHRRDDQGGDRPTRTEA